MKFIALLAMVSVSNYLIHTNESMSVNRQLQQMAYFVFGMEVLRSGMQPLSHLHSTSQYVAAVYTWRLQFFVHSVTGSFSILGVACTAVPPYRFTAALCTHSRSLCIGFEVGFIMTTSPMVYAVEEAIVNVVADTIGPAPLPLSLPAFFTHSGSSTICVAPCLILPFARAGLYHNCSTRFMRSMCRRT